VDSLILYTPATDAFWGALPARFHEGVRLHGAPPNVAVEVSSDCRLYISEQELSPPIPETLQGSDGLRALVIDRTNRKSAERFVAPVLRGIPGFIDADDDSRLVPVAQFVAAVMDGQR
jgi:hypothetical protein